MVAGVLRVRGPNKKQPLFSPVWVRHTPQANAAVVQNFCDERDWIRNLAVDPSTASNTSVCLSVDLEKDEVRRHPWQLGLKVGESF